MPECIGAGSAQSSTCGDSRGEEVLDSMPECRGAASAQSSLRGGENSGRLLGIKSAVGGEEVLSLLAERLSSPASLSKTALRAHCTSIGGGAGVLDQNYLLDPLLRLEPT